MIVLYTGRRGNGKTLTMVKDAYNYYCDGWRIYSNMKSLNFPNTYISEEEMLKIDKHTDLKDCVLLIDEIQLLLESRSSMKKTNKQFSYFIQQIRKRGIIMLATTQFTNTTDKRLRQHLDVKCEPYIDKKLDVVEAFYLDLTSFGNNGLFEEMLNLEQQGNSASVVYDARQVFNLFDTNEQI